MWNRWIYRSEKVVPILLAGLKRLEYRGYDSAGIAFLENGDLHVIKKAGKLRHLEDTVNTILNNSTIGIGHTRWATHGEPTEQNAHPHIDSTGKIAIIHNGIIENYVALKKMLEGKGHAFRSDTDTEIVAHLIEEFYEGDFEDAFRRALVELKVPMDLRLLRVTIPIKYMSRVREVPW